ncbi:LysR family transcriptional regulator [Teichococcus deserti]|nr:LysR family transcriptional regulator [Pseudoroseomonas deserti]
MKPLRLDGLDAFAAVVRAGGFRAAALQRGVSSSALSQAVAALEASLGLRLLHRTTRSLAPTEAGAALFDRLSPALEDIRAAVDGLNRLRDSPSGSLRINAPGPAADHVLCPLAFDFMRAHPGVQVEIISDAALVDIVSQGFDAGVRFGRQVAQDMVAVPIGPPLRYAIVASPAYLAGRDLPATPQDLARHDCIRRRFPKGGLVAWQFEKDGEAVGFEPQGRLTLGSAHQELQAALAGQGVAHLFEEYVRPHLDSGALVELLPEWSPRLPGWFLYYPSRRHPSGAMRAFLAHLRSTR